jgi:hypothetical protein
LWLLVEVLVAKNKAAAVGLVDLEPEQVHL